MTTTEVPTDATKASKNARSHGFYATEVVLLPQISRSSTTCCETTGTNIVRRASRKTDW